MSEQQREEKQNRVSNFSHKALVQAASQPPERRRSGPQRGPQAWRKERKRSYRRAQLREAGSGQARAAELARL